MYSDQTNSVSIDLPVACAAVCLFCGLIEVALFCFHASGASMLALVMTEVGSIVALVNMVAFRQKFGIVARRKSRSTLFSDAMTSGEKALLTRLRAKPIAIVAESDGWRPAGALPHRATRADFDAVIRDGFATVDTARGLLRIGRE